MKFISSILLLVMIVGCGGGSSKDSKWILPNKDNCENNGGIYNRDSNEKECHASWENAQKICQASKGVLPTIESLREVVIDCGTTMGASRDDTENKLYQDCYQNKGFSIANTYWSSSVFELDNSEAWYLYFYDSFDDFINKEMEESVMCVKEEE